MLSFLVTFYSMTKIVVNKKGIKMNKYIKVLFLVMFSVVLAGCSSVPNFPSIDKTIINWVGDKAVPKNSNLAVYSCWGATQELSDWKPIWSTTRVWPDRVIVVDEGSHFTVDYPTAVIESPQLFKVPGVTGAVAINKTTAARYYRLDAPKLAYGMSTLTEQGNGIGLVFFNCGTDGLRTADPSSVTVVK